MKHRDRKLRSVAKTISYRVLIVISDVIIIYALTRRIDVTIGVTGLANIVRTLLYYGHERMWENIAWGGKTG